MQVYLMTPLYSYADCDSEINLISRAVKFVFMEHFFDFDISG